MKKQSVKIWQSYNFEDAKYHLFTNLDMYLSEESSGLGRTDKDQSEVVFPPGDTVYNGKEFYQLYATTRMERALCSKRHHGF